MTVVPVTSADMDAVEVSWFAALCSDDYQSLGVPDGDLRSSWAHCSGIVKEAEAREYADYIVSKLEAYQKMGMRAFILSGYPHIDEAKHFGARVMPHLNTCSLPHAYGRVPASTPQTPLGIGERR